MISFTRSDSVRFSGGGEGSSRNFPLSRLPGQIQWGGGSSRNFPLSRLPDQIQWGGGK